MITTAEFKKHIAKPFGLEMRTFGFKGTGFEYFQETADFLFVVFITPSSWGKRCTAGFAMHPKKIDKNSSGTLNLKKIKIHQYEFKMSLTNYARGEWWEYADNETSNLDTLTKIISSIKNKALPVIEKFKRNPNILDTFTVKEIDNFHKNWIKKTGVSISTTEIRFAWAMTIIFENSEPSTAKEFAKWGLAQLTDGHDWFGKKDFVRVLVANNGA